MIRYTVKTQSHGSDRLDDFKGDCFIPPLLARGDNKKEIDFSLFHYFKILEHNLPPHWLHPGQGLPTTQPHLWYATSAPH